MGNIIHIVGVFNTHSWITLYEYFVDIIHIVEVHNVHGLSTYYT